MSVAHYFDTMDYGPAPESDSEARAWLARHDKGFGHFIGGSCVNGKSHFETLEPATGKVLAELSQSSTADIDAAGKAAVLNPADFTPLSALLFAELAERAGLPPGVLNVVTGDGETGAALVKHKDVDKIAFTGSTEVGRLIRKETAGTGKSLTLE